MEPNARLVYDPGLELHHPNMSMLGGHRGWLESEREHTVETVTTV